MSCLELLGLALTLGVAGIGITIAFAVLIGNRQKQESIEISADKEKISVKLSKENVLSRPKAKLKVVD